MSFSSCFANIVQKIPESKIILYNFEKLSGYKFSVQVIEKLVKDFPKQIVKTFLGILKYSTVLAKANELGGIMQTSDSKLTKLFSSNALGSTTAELMLVNILNSVEQRTS